MRLGFLGRDLLSIYELLNERLIFCDLIDLSVADEISPAVSDLYDVDTFGRNSDAGEGRAHTLKLRIGTALLVNQIVRVNCRVIKLRDEIVLHAFRSKSSVGVFVAQEFLTDTFDRH